jgi:formate/nitrite transporter FocA (FNT family)
MMKKTLAGFRATGSFIAGVLLGVSIVVPVIALTGADPADGRTFLAFGGPLVLCFGIALQAVVTARSRRAHTVDAALAV